MNFRFPGLKEDYTAAGTRRWRVRAEGNRNKLTKLPMGPREPGFNEHYAAARRGEKLATGKPVRAKTGTLDALCEAFSVWMTEQVEYGQVSPSTLSGRRTGMNHARNTLDLDGDRMGSLDADLPEEAFVHIQDGFGGRTGAADTCIKALRAAYKWGAKRGYPKQCAVFNVERVHKEGGGATPWEASDIKQYLEKHGPGSMARLWFCMAYATHCRISDSPTMGPCNETFHEGVRFIEWQPKKKGSAFVSIPMDDVLCDELKHHEARETYLVTERGTPFASSGSLDNRVRKWIIDAGLFGLIEDTNGVANKKATRSQHGIRKGVAELMAESGATEFEIMASFGWTEAKTAAVYTKKFDRRSSAISASKRMSEKALSSVVGPRFVGRGPHPDQDTNNTTKK